MGPTDSTSIYHVITNTKVVTYYIEDPRDLSDADETRKNKERNPQKTTSLKLNEHHSTKLFVQLQAPNVLFNVSAGNQTHEIL